MLEASQLRGKITDLESRGFLVGASRPFPSPEGSLAGAEGLRAGPAKKGQSVGSSPVYLPLISENLNGCSINPPTGTQGISRTPGVMHWVKNTTKCMFVGGVDGGMVQM